MARRETVTCDVCGAIMEPHGEDRVITPIVRTVPGVDGQGCAHMTYQIRGQIDAPRVPQVNGHDLCLSCYRMLQKAQRLGIITMPDTVPPVEDVELREHANNT